MNYKMIAVLITLSLLSVSCNKSGGSSSEESVTHTSTATGDKEGDGLDKPIVPPVSSTLPAAALSFKANVTLFDFTTSQEDKYNEAIAIVKKVVATEEFRNKVINYNYAGTKMFSTTSLTNAQIYQSILDAAEELKPAKNNTIDLGVKLYYEASTVVGYTNASITYINVNTKFFDQFDINEVAGNLFHEWLHKLGYEHDSSSTARRPYSVPYAIGYMIRDIGADFL